MIFRFTTLAVLGLMVCFECYAQVVPSTEENEVWYYLTSTANKPYCKNRIIYNSAPQPGRQLRWGDNTKDVNAMWKFVPAGEQGYYIVNKATNFYMKSTSNGNKSGVVSTTDQRSDATIFFIHQQGNNKSYTLSGNNQNPIHAQEYGGMMVTWNDTSLGSASSWMPQPINSSIVEAAEKKFESYQKDYKLVWSQEFNDPNESLDDFWNFEKGFVRNQEDQWYQRDNASLPDTCLLIQARKTHIPNPNYQAGSNNWRTNREYIDYTSSCLTSNGKFDFTYGRLEVRAKIPTSAGTWPAIWTLGLETPNSDYHWPHSGEVDLMEFYKNQTLSNLVWGGGGQWASIWESRKTPLDYWQKFDKNWTNDYHVWRMDWDYEAIKLYLDDELVTICNLNRTRNLFGSASGTNPFRGKPQYILLNLALGGQSAGRIDNSAFPVDYRVDYVRVYQKEGQTHRIHQQEITTGIQQVGMTTNGEPLSYQLQDKVLNIQLKSAAQVSLIQTDGRTAYQQHLSAGSHSISLQTLQHGIYILHVQDASGSKSVKLVR